MNIIHLSTLYKHNYRKNTAKCFIVHTTGDTDLRDIIDYYSTSSEGVSPHYMIDYDGTVRQFVNDDCVAYHAGYGPEQVNLYRSGWAVWSCRINNPPWKVLTPYSGYSTWAVRWKDSGDFPKNDSFPRKRGLQSPLELLCGTNPNGLSIGIELREPEHPITDHFTNEQYTSLSQLIRTRALLYNIPVNRDTVLGHYDLNPISRGDKRGDWDPGESFNWNRLLTASTL